MVFITYDKEWKGIFDGNNGTDQDTHTNIIQIMG